MKRLLIIAILLSNLTFAQNEYQVIQDRDYFRKEGWKSLTMGLISHAGTLTVYPHGPISDPRVATGIIVFNTVGVFLDFRAFMCFREARKRTKLIKATPSYK